ncbi:MAG: thioredoxin family protein [Clostridia bacterium]|jgi:thiol-disulfide isomerase/thioredoxin|nr:thioredoxin family protein [Clostridia bacterium]MDH7573115.1 thioredoxin family protein [Clostridia bacterium]
MVTIKIIGPTPPCSKCKEVEKRAKKVAQKYEGKIEVLKLDAVSPEGRKYGALITPAVLINDKVLSSGKVLSEADIERAVKKELGG